MSGPERKNRVQRKKPELGWTRTVCDLCREGTLSPFMSGSGEVPSSFLYQKGEARPRYPIFFSPRELALFQNGYSRRTPPICGANTGSRSRTEIVTHSSGVRGREKSRKGYSPGRFMASRGVCRPATRRGDTVRGVGGTCSKGNDETRGAVLLLLLRDTDCPRR